MLEMKSEMKKKKKSDAEKSKDTRKDGKVGKGRKEKLIERLHKVIVLCYGMLEVKLEMRNKDAGKKMREERR